jgi:hypothetical protein
MILYGCGASDGSSDAKQARGSRPYLGGASHVSSHAEVGVHWCHSHPGDVSETGRYVLRALCNDV